MKVIISILVLILTYSNIYSQNTILWSITDSNSKHTSYLLGTYHQMGNSFVDSIPQIKDALFSCNLSIFESLDNGAKVRALLNSRNENNNYKKELKKSDLIFLDTFAINWGVSISKLTPMELLTKLQQRYFETQCGTIKPTDKWDQFDAYFIHLSKSNGIKTIGLENDSIQTNNINRSEFSDDWNKLKKPIHAWIENIKKSKKTSSYCQSAINYMGMNFNYQFEEKCADNPMLKGRNQEWMKSIPDYLSNQSCFIAVGIMHLYGDCGLIQQLRSLGYKITEVELEIKK